MRKFLRTLPVACVILFEWNGFALAAETVDFVRDVQPLLKARCQRCHSPTTRKGGLDLSTAAGLLQGSESGRVLVPGKPSKSRLWEVLHEGEMPPEGNRALTGSQVELLERWITQGAALGETSQSQKKTLNQHDVLPILLLRCVTCHGRQIQEGGLDLRSTAAMLKGGKSGPALVAGDADASLLIQKIRAQQMPPREKLAAYSIKPVEASELERLIQWIEQGAAEVNVLADVANGEPDSMVDEEDRQFWAFQSPQRPDLPAADVDNASPVGMPVLQNPVDRFVQRRLAERELHLAPRADLLTLLRRAHFDLLGLPPSAALVQQVVETADPLAYEKWIDRLLASPHYGERWGQYWLDLAGYADSEGVQHSDPVRPHAFRYRDYVIRAFNSDKPYSRFLMEQIAGDELADYETSAVIDDAMYDNLVATGFLRMSADGTFAGITGFVPNRLDVIDDQLRILTASVMGLTVRCARCHSHKFDPIPQRDYYRLVALLKPAFDENDWLKPIGGGNGQAAGKVRYLPYVTTAERTTWENAEYKLSEQIDALQTAIKKKPGDDAFKKKAETQIKSLEAQRRPQPMVRALWDRGQPSPTYLLQRGDYMRPGHLVGPGIPSVLTSDQTPFNPQPPWKDARKTGNRLALARWLTRADHPLAARVIVNRVWKHHFGRGIVATLDDFGAAGARPTHPELLDWLAVEFIESGWSLKHLHRLLMTSATYQQDSAVVREHQLRDPDNRWLSRMSLRRMEAEVLRDSLLAMSDKLDRRAFGPADAIESREDGLVTSRAQDGGYRRSVYVLKRRTKRLTILDNFDRPRMSPNCVDRTVSTVAPQALHLMNNKMVHQLSLSFADRMISETGRSASAQIRGMYLTAVGRPPDAVELEALTDSLVALRGRWETYLMQNAKALDGQQNEPAAHRFALGNLVHAMMNSAAFLYID